ncbi:MAG: VanZ family protein [Mangrovibacterium sp.]
MTTKHAQQLNLWAIILWIAGILYACLTPNEDMPKVNFFEGFDKLMHFLFYFGFIILLLIYRLQKHWNNAWGGAMIALVASFGIGVEYLQRALEEGRSFSVEDMLANCLGLLGGIVIYLLLESTLARFLSALKK